MKVLVGLGCSFVAGVEAGKHQGSFIRHLADYAGYEYLNLGLEAQGNMGSILQLLYNIDLLEKYSGVDVFFMPTGLNRVDIINPDFNRYFPFTPVFPSSKPIMTTQTSYDYELAYGKYWNESCQIINFATACSILNLVVEKLKANLYIFPAFSTNYDKEVFDSILSKHRLNKLIPWDKFLIFNNVTNFWNWTVKKSGSAYEGDMMDYSLNLRSDPALNGWVEKRYHPSAKAHKLFAEELALKLGYVKKTQGEG
jgi:hypothetical protein